MDKRRKFWVLWTAFLLLGFLLSFTPWDKWPIVHGQVFLSDFYRNLLWKFGEAIIVAQFLALVVDAAAKQRLLEEFAEDVSTHIIGRRLPPQLRKYIEQYLEADLVRTTWTITYTITEWPEQPEYDRLVTLSVYELENRSSSTNKYESIYEIESSSFPNIGKTEILHFTGTNLLDAKDFFDYPRQSEIKPKECDRCITISKDVHIPAHRGPAYRFSAESVECFRDGSIVPFFAKQPVLSTTLTVFYPTDRMKVFVDLSFGNIEEDAERIELSNGLQWVFNRPILPGQGFSTRFVKVPSHS